MSLLLRKLSYIDYPVLDFYLKPTAIAVYPRLLKNSYIIYTISGMLKVDFKRC